MPLKNDTFEYRKTVVRPDMIVKLVEMGLCKERVLLQELKRPFNGRFYYTTDTNRFFFDFNNKRYELNVFGEGGGSAPIDLSAYAKKKDIPKKTSQLTNDSGFITLMNLSDFLSQNNFVTADMLSQAVSNLIGIDIFNELVARVNSMEENIEEIKEKIGDSDSDGLSDLLRRMLELEERVEMESSWEDFQRE